MDADPFAPAHRTVSTSNGASVQAFTNLINAVQAFPQAAQNINFLLNTAYDPSSPTTSNQALLQTANAILPGMNGATNAQVNAVLTTLNSLNDISQLGAVCRALQAWSGKAFGQEPIVDLKMFQEGIRFYDTTPEQGFAMYWTAVAAALVAPTTGGTLLQFTPDEFILGGGGHLEVVNYRENDLLHLFAHLFQNPDRSDHSYFISQSAGVPNDPAATLLLANSAHQAISLA